MSSVEKRQAYWREAIEYCEPQVQVAIDGDKIVGFVGFDRSRDEKSRQTTGEIWAIYAAPPIGTKAWAWPCGMPPATVWSKKAAPTSPAGCRCAMNALRFHESAGFKREMTTAKTAVIGGVKIEEVRLKRALN
jgi:hypothetical protein